MLVYLVTPQSGEVTEALLRLVSSAPTAHPAHVLVDEVGVEHGCSGSSHCCHCHRSVSFLADHAPIEVESARSSLSVADWFVAEPVADGVPTDIFRPPTA